MTNDKQRDRLVELLRKVPRNTAAFYGQFADYLLANGVIVPPCKVGDYVYYTIDGVINKAKIEERKFNDSKHGHYSYSWYIHAYDLKNKLEISFSPDNMYDLKCVQNKWCEINIYFTKEEAEQALGGGKG